MASLRVTRGIESTFPHPFLETFRISKNEDINGSYLENKKRIFQKFLRNCFQGFKSRDRGQLVSAFQLTFKIFNLTAADSEDNEDEMDYLTLKALAVKLIGSSLVKQQIV